MAVTTDNLIIALRLGDTTEERAIADRLRQVAVEVVDKTAPDAPTIIKDEAIIRLCGYWFDQPQAARGTAYASAMRNSGAKAILLPYRVLKARIAG